MKQKKRNTDSLKRIPNRLFNFVFFEHIDLNLSKLFYENQPDLTQKSFLKDLLRQRKDGNRREKV